MKSAKEIREVVKLAIERDQKAEWEKLEREIEEAANEQRSGTPLAIHYSQHVEELKKLGFIVKRSGGVNSILYHVRWRESK